MSSRECEVCHRVSPVVVHCSAFGPISHAYCKECEAKPAEPLYMLKYIYVEVRNKGDGLAPFVQGFFTWRDGVYLSWPDYVKERGAEHSTLVR